MYQFGVQNLPGQSGLSRPPGFFSGQQQKRLCTGKIGIELGIRQIPNGLTIPGNGICSQKRVSYGLYYAKNIT